MNKNDQILGELEVFLDWGRTGFIGYPLFHDPTLSRLVDVARCMRSECLEEVGHSHASPIEFAVLLRQIVRRFNDGLKKEVLVRLPDGVNDAILSEVGMTSFPVEGGLLRLTANPWKPSWLGASSDTGAVDDASLSPLNVNARARFIGNSSPIKADPQFEVATGNASYRSPGQLAATRSALSTEFGSTLIVQLPTGGGKTDVAIAALKTAIFEATQKTNVIIVPTVALALDLERRIRHVIGEVWGYQDQVLDMPLTWTGETPSEQRQVIREGIATGVQPILITSPEVLAMDSGVGASLEIAAANDRMGWLIVDEAHIIKQWGQDFRPDFLDIVLLRNKLKRCAEDNGFSPLRTMLLSATYTAETLEYLVDKFEDESPIHLCAANELRPELDIWTDVSENRDIRQKKFLEAVRHLPRPLIVYATKPEEANKWAELLQKEGFSRSSTFSGKTVGRDRKEILQKFRNDLGTASGYDIVVATSAFGLGVDYDQVRSVVHVCLPETVDRWYQEIGRGGRDGYLSTAVTLTCVTDLGDAQGLGVSVLTPEVAWKRFKSIKENLKVGTERDPAWRYLDLHENMFGVQRGSYNRRWNKQVLRGLIDLGLMEQKITWRRDIPIQDREKLEHLQSDEDVRSEIMRVKILRNISRDEFFELWNNWKSYELNQQNISLQEFLSVLKRESSVCEMLEDTYTDSNILRRKFRQSASTLKVHAGCGQCPRCRSARCSSQDYGVPSPVVGLISGLSTEDHDVLTGIAYHSPDNLRLMIHCDGQEAQQCVQMLSDAMQIHLIDLTENRDWANTNVEWIDFSIDFMLATPAIPLVILHNGSIESVAGVIKKRYYLSPKMPIFLVGKSDILLETFSKVTYETLKFWLEKS
jgi:ATP-dependent DNA helicase RecQ